MGKIAGERWAAACWAGLIVGCVSVETPAPPSPIAAPVQPTTAPERPVETNLSGALDGPTLRLALHDLAIILDTLGRVEQARPELRSQMLRELAEADATTVASVVRRWRERAVEYQRASQEVRITATEPVPKPPPAESKPPATLVLANAPRPVPEPIEPPPAPQAGWEELLESFEDETLERAESDGPAAIRARVQLALLELIREVEQTPFVDNSPDPELWSRLQPALELALGVSTPGSTTARSALAALTAAAESLREPARFHARNLTFCKRVLGYGSVERADTAEFARGHPLLLYCEVENFATEKTTNGFRTKIGSELELIDSGGQSVWSQQFGAIEDSSSAPRRDYFLSHSFRLSSKLAPGQYRLRLTLNDELASRSTSATIDLVAR